jgi:hypothetical protein
MALGFEANDVLVLGYAERRLVGRVSVVPKLVGVRTMQSFKQVTALHQLDETVRLPLSQFLVPQLIVGFHLHEQHRCHARQLDLIAHQWWQFLEIENVLVQQLLDIRPTTSLTPMVTELNGALEDATVFSYVFITLHTLALGDLLDVQYA